MSDLIIDCAELFTRPLSKGELQMSVLESIVKNLGVSSATYFALSDSSYELESFIGQQPLDTQGALSTSSPILRKLIDGRPLDLTAPEIQQTLRGAECSAERDIIDGLSAQFIIRVSTDMQCYGLLAIGSRRNGELLLISELFDIVLIAYTLALRMELSALGTFARTELESAWEIQKKLLNANFPDVHGIDCRVVFKPARIVSGDFYDFLNLPRKRLGFAIGDVAGKGISAALMMANLIVSLTRAMLAKADDLEDLMSDLHSLVYESAPSSRYSTLFYAIYDPERASLRYVSAGHDPPAILIRGIHKPTVIELAYGGGVLGLFPSPRDPYEVGQVGLQRGDCVIVATDGVTDAANATGQCWGKEAFHSCAVEAYSSRRGAQGIAWYILEAASNFMAPPQPDDMTVLVFKVLD